MSELSEIRRRAWATRRAKYGKAGHSGTYARGNHAGLLNLVVRLHVEGVLSEGQVARASGLDRVQIRTMADAQTHSPNHPSKPGQTT